MNGSRQNDPLLVRLARWLLDVAVRRWPEETRQWGLAVAAEMDETTDLWESLSWSLGGIMLFWRSLARSVWSWLNLPVGVSLSRGGEHSSMLPQRSRLSTVALLAAAAAILLLPQGREALNTFRSSWSGFAPTGFDFWQLDRTGRRAEKQNDASTLAFVALSTDDPERFLSLADRAVSIDPQYVWIYAAVSTRWSQYAPRIMEKLERTEAYDPDNAAPALLRASLAANARIARLYERYSPREEEIQTMLERDPEWMALMNRAFAAPRYDSYRGRHAQLISGVWKREKSLSPAIVLAGLWSHPTPDLSSLRAFSRTKFRQAEASAASGDLLEARRLVGLVSRFGERMAGGEPGNAYSNAENLAGLMLERDATKELAKLYRSSGFSSDAQEAARHLTQLDDRLSVLNRTLEANSFARMRAFRRLGWLVQGLGILLVLAALAVFGALLMFEIAPSMLTTRRRWLEKAACSMADYAPATLLVSTSAFLVSFLPYARIFAEYRTSTRPLSEEHQMVEALWGLGAIPVRVLSSSYEVSFWLAVTLALSALAIFIVARGLYRSWRVRAIARP